MKPVGLGNSRMSTGSAQSPFKTLISKNVNRIKRVRFHHNDKLFSRPIVTFSLEWPSWVGLGYMSCNVFELYFVNACLSIFSLINLGEAQSLSIIRMEWLIVANLCYHDRACHDRCNMVTIVSFFLSFWCKGDNVNWFPISIGQE